MELLIYAAVLAVMSTVIVNVFLGITIGRGRFTAESEVNSNLRFALEKINQDIRAASVITTPATPAGTTSQTLVVNIGGAEGTVTYCVLSGVLRRQPNGGACSSDSAAVTSDKVSVTAPTFTRFENTNSNLPVALGTALTIQTSITMAYAREGFQYSATKTTTELLP